MKSRTHLVNYACGFPGDNLNTIRYVSDTLRNAARDMQAETCVLVAAITSLLPPGYPKEPRDVPGRLQTNTCFSFILLVARS